jgi:hypothetical protein
MLVKLVTKQKESKVRIYNNGTEKSFAPVVLGQKQKKSKIKTQTLTRKIAPKKALFLF